MLKSPEEKGKATRFVKELGIHPPKKRKTKKKEGYQREETNCGRVYHGRTSYRIRRHFGIQCR